MLAPVAYPFVDAKSAHGSVSKLPYIPIVLAHHQATVSVMGLLDTGATVSVLPYQVGIDLGGDWHALSIPLQLGGNLSSVPAKALLLEGVVGGFAPVQLAFAWSQSNDIPLILGQMNFFMEFDVCFFRSRSVLEIKPK